MPSIMSDDLRSGALIYHRLPKPGKLEIQATKPVRRLYRIRPKRRN